MSLALLQRWLAPWLPPPYRLPAPDVIPEVTQPAASCRLRVDALVPRPPLLRAALLVAVSAVAGVLTPVEDDPDDGARWGRSPDDAFENNDDEPWGTIGPRWRGMSLALERAGPLEPASAV